jgi:hypothetical protein
MTDQDDPGTMLGERAYKALPRDEWEFNPHLMTPGRLVELAKRRGVRVQRDERGVVVVCADCEGQIMPLAPSPVRGRKRIADMSDAERREAAREVEAWGPTYTLDLGQLLADTVRHGVMVHDDALSGIQGG